MYILSGQIKSISVCVTLVFAALMFSASASAVEQIRVEEVTGQVQFRFDTEDAWKSAEVGMSVPAPVEFKALAGGSGVLSQSGSEFELKGGSHITLQAETAEPKGLVNTIKQWFGTVFYRIERQPDQFSVETPFLVSTVKGTQFVIVSTETSSLVTLTEGSLEVRDVASGQSQLMAPGDVVGVSAEQAGIQAIQQSEPSQAAAAGVEAISVPEPVEQAGEAAGFGANLDQFSEEESAEDYAVPDVGDSLDVDLGADVGGDLTGDDGKGDLGDDGLGDDLGSGQDDDDDDDDDDDLDDDDDDLDDDDD